MEMALDIKRNITSKQAPRKIPAPKDKRGYTIEELKGIFGSNAKTILRGIKGCTVQRNESDEILIPKIDILRAWNVLRKGYSEIPWD